MNVHGHISVTQSPLVYLRVRSGWCMLCGLGQVSARKQPRLQCTESSCCLQILCASLHHSLLLPVPANPCSSYCLHSIAFSRTSQSQNHLGCSLQPSFQPCLHCIPLCQGSLCPMPLFTLGSGCLLRRQCLSSWFALLLLQPFFPRWRQSSLLPEPVFTFRHSVLPFSILTHVVFSTCSTASLLG